MGVVTVSARSACIARGSAAAENIASHRAAARISAFFMEALRPFPAGPVPYLV